MISRVEVREKQVHTGIILTTHSECALHAFCILAQARQNNAYARDMRGISQDL